MTKKILGIDLGTTNSCAAIMEGAELKILENLDGQRTTPSVVAETQKDKNIEIVVGDIARNGALFNLKHTYACTKRFIGRQLSEVTGEEKKNISYNLTNGTEGEVLITGRQKSLTPEEIGAHILRYIKNFADAKLHSDIKDVVITVPAYFNDSQRQATKNAGEIAGLNVLRIINEPTAAALAYGLDKKEAAKVLVYDLGGGTFDVSILSIDNGVIEVIATKGDTFLGGEDFDNRIVKYIVEEFKTQHKIDLSKEPQALQRIKKDAESAKKILSSSETTEINIPFIHQTLEGSLNLSVTLTRARFNMLVQDLVSRTIVIVKEALKDAKLTYKDMDEILFVGGQTRSYIISEEIEKLFNKKPNKSVNPDEVVAMGAAIQGAILSGNNSHVKDLLLLDVTPLSLGIETLGGALTVLVPKNTTIPVSKKQTFSTAEDNQTAVTISVYQGERPMARDNKLLGQFELSGIIPAKRGIPQIEISFSLNANGILEVTAMDQQTKKEQKITVTNSGGLSKEEIEKMKQEAEQYAEEDKKKSLFVEVKNQLENSIYQTEKNIIEFKEKLSEEFKTEINTKIDEAKEILKTNEDIDIFRKHITDLQEIMTKIGEEVNKKYKEDEPKSAEPAVENPEENSDENPKE
jgi:molecular chaperone DnaK